MPFTDYIYSAPGDLRFNDLAAGGHTAAAVKEYHIKYNELIFALNFVHLLKNNNKYWNVQWDNCTDETIWAGNEALIETIWSWPPWTSPDDLADALD